MDIICGPFGHNLKPHSNVSVACHAQMGIPWWFNWEVADCHLEYRAQWQSNLSALLCGNPCKIKQLNLLLCIFNGNMHEWLSHLKGQKTLLHNNFFKKFYLQIFNKDCENFSFVKQRHVVGLQEKENGSSKLIVGSVWFNTKSLSQIPNAGHQGTTTST